MIRHIVLWKLGAEVAAAEKTAILQEMKRQLMGLKSEVSVLQSISVFTNSEKASSANFDIMLDTLFANMDDLNTYQVHPSHVKVVEYVKTLKLQRAAIDYEI